MMLRPPLRSVLDTMEAESLLSERDRESLRDAAPAFASDQHIPWYLHAVMVGVAWVAAPCIAVAPLSTFNDEALHVAMGLLGCAGVCVARWRWRHPLVGHFLLAFSVVFQLLAVFGFLGVCDESEATGVLSALLFGTLFVVYADPVHRVVMVFATLTATILTGLAADWAYVLEMHAVVALSVAALLWGPATPRMLGRAGALVRPAALGLLIGGLVCAALCGTQFVRHEIDSEVEHALRPLVASIPLWAALVAVVVIRLRQHTVRITAWPTVAAVLGVAIAAVAAPERPLLPAALLAILLAFHARDVVGIAFALLALVWEAVFLWVATDVAALPRAVSVLTTGAVLVGIWWVAQRRPATALRRSS